MKSIFTSIFVLLFSIMLSAQTTYFVSNQGDDSNDGLTWATAKATINAAIDCATVYDNDSIFVATGVYLPFTLYATVHVYGGFSGTENYLCQRPALTDSTYSIVDAQSVYNRAVNVSRFYNGSYHSSFNTDLNGFYLTGAVNAGLYISTYCRISNCIVAGNAGGGLEINSTSNVEVEVSDSKIFNNQTNGGVYLHKVEAPAWTITFLRCVITENVGSVCGGIYCDRNNPQANLQVSIIDCEISKNIASGDVAKAGAILVLGSNAYYTTSSQWAIVNSKIIDNVVNNTRTSAFDYIAIVGGVNGSGGSTHLIGCVVANNSAISMHGLAVAGGIGANSGTSTATTYNFPYQSGSLHITNCIVANNWAQSTTTNAKGGIISQRAAVVRNTILYNNKRNNSNSQFSYNSNFTFPYAYCAANLLPANNIFYSDSTNIMLDSLGNQFVSPSVMVGANPNLSDRSNIIADWHLLPNSPLIDAGDPNTAFIAFVPATDMDGNPRCGNTRADIGCYEYANTTFNQTITWPQTLNADLSDQFFILEATATSGLPVQFSSSDTNVAIVNGNLLTLVGEGYAIITAAQPGNTTWNPAPTISKILTVTDSIVQQSQTILWEQELDFMLEESPVILTAVATSGLPVQFSSSDETVATVNGNQLILVGEGVTLITASQPGNDSWNPAPEVVKILTVTDVVGLQQQTILWEQELNFTLEDSPIILAAASTSGLPVQFSSSDETVATIMGNLMTLHSEGLTIITASQPGNSQYAPASSVMKILNVQSVGIHDVDDNNVVIFPNPAHDFVNVVSQQNVRRIEILGMEGRIIDQYDVNDDHVTINTLNLLSGLYILRISLSSGEVFIRKVMIQ